MEKVKLSLKNSLNSSYQAELVSIDPLRWNSVIIVALEKVEVENEKENQSDN